MCNLKLTSYTSEEYWGIPVKEWQAMALTGDMTLDDTNAKFKIGTQVIFRGEVCTITGFNEVGAIMDDIDFEVQRESGEAPESFYLGDEYMLADYPFYVWEYELEEVQ
jgi:hypothetical protein